MNAQAEVLLIPSTFQPEDLRLCQAVLDRACADLGIDGEADRAELAARIMSLADAGERDFEKLRAFAVAGFGKPKAL